MSEEATTTPALPERLEPVIAYLEGLEPEHTFNPGNAYQCPLRALLLAQGAPDPFVWETHYVLDKRTQDPQGPPSWVGEEDSAAALEARGYRPVAPILVTLQRAWMDHQDRHGTLGLRLPARALLATARRLKEDADAPAC